MNQTRTISIHRSKEHEIIKNCSILSGTDLQDYLFSVSDDLHMILGSRLCGSLEDLRLNIVDHYDIGGDHLHYAFMCAHPYRWTKKNNLPYSLYEEGRGELIAYLDVLLSEDKTFNEIKVSMNFVTIVLIDLYDRDILNDNEKVWFLRIFEVWAPIFIKYQKQFNGHIQGVLEDLLIAALDYIGDLEEYYDIHMDALSLVIYSILMSIDNSSSGDDWGKQILYYTEKIVNKASEKNNLYCSVEKLLLHTKEILRKDNFQVYYFCGQVLLALQQYFINIGLARYEGGKLMIDSEEGGLMDLYYFCLGVYWYYSNNQLDKDFMWAFEQINNRKLFVDDIQSYCPGITNRPVFTIVR